MSAKPLNVVVCFALVSLCAGRCLEAPDWLHRYREFHMTNRGNDSARFLVHEGHQHTSGGFGDRLHGIGFSLRLAAATNRVLLLRWKFPADVTNFFIPNQIDWRVHNAMIPALEETPLLWWHASQYPRVKGPNPNISVSFTAPTFNTLWPQRVVRISHNYRWYFPLNATSAKQGPESQKEGHCLFSFLFNFSPTVESIAANIIEETYGRATHKYVAGHLRIGGLIGEDKTIVRGMDRFGGLLSVLSCSISLAAQSGINVQDTPIFLVTDNNDLKVIARSKLFNGFVVSNVSAVHVDRVSSSLIEHQKTLAEILILSKAVCLVRTVSGFSEIAHMFGGQQCQKVVSRYELCHMSLG